MRIVFMLAFTIGLVVCFVYLQDQENKAQQQLRPQKVMDNQAVFQHTRDGTNTIGGNPSS